MLWYKSWLDTRWRFLLALGLLIVSVFGLVLSYPRLQALIPLAPAGNPGGELGKRLREALEVSRQFRGYVWLQWYRQNALQVCVAALLGTGGLVTHGSRGALFTLSLPVSRDRLIAVRAAAGLGELLVVAFVSVLLLPALSPAIGERYAVGEAVAHGICLFAAASVFFSLAFLLSTSFDDGWRPLLIAVSAAAVLGLCDLVLRDLVPYSVFTVMSGDVYFRTGHLPWLGIAVSLGASAGMLLVARMNLARRDF
jgi:hypothetical protein